MATPRRWVAVSLALTLATSLPGLALAQPDPASEPSRLEQLEKRFDDLEQKYEAQLKKRDQTIAELSDQLERRAATQAQQQSDVARQKIDILAQIEADTAPPRTLRTPASFNPDIAVIADFLGSWSDHQSNKALNRFDVREVELDIRAPVDPRADAVAILAIARDVEDPIFEAEEVEGPETSIAVEEMYLYFHNFGVPNLTAKLGRFHVRFGRQNILHLHDLPTVNPALVNRSFLAPEALSDAGVSLSYLLDNPWDQYLEVIVEVLTGEGANSESPTLNSDLHVESPAFNTHLLWNADLTPRWNLELGFSHLHGSHDISDEDHPDRFGEADLLGVDLTLIRTDPTGGFDNLLLQGEMIHGIIDQADGRTARAWGAYVLAQQQINRDWYAGVRLDWTQDANDPDLEAWAVSPYVSWYWSEFLRFRAQYEHREGDLDATDILYFQVTWIFGAHPPHPYWSMK